MPLKAKRIDSKLESLSKAKAAFIEPMLLFRSGAFAQAADWVYELSSMPMSTVPNAWRSGAG